MIVKTFDIKNIRKSDLFRTLKIFQKDIEEYIIKNNKLMILGKDTFNFIEFKKVLDIVFF